MIELGRYQHFKGSYYQVLHLAKHSETEELLVVYQPEYGARDIWVRPLAMFNETLIKDNKTVKRFSKVNDHLT
jgi:hypothetical protein